MRQWTPEERLKQGQLIHRWKPWEKTKFRKSSGWSEERRRRHRERMRRLKPWLKSTGPKTEEGKAVVSQNALKHGGRSAEVRRIQKVMAGFRKNLKNLEVL